MEKNFLDATFNSFSQDAQNTHNPTQFLNITFSLPVTCLVVTPLIIHHPQNLSLMIDCKIFRSGFAVLNDNLFPIRNRIFMA